MRINNLENANKKNIRKIKDMTQKITQLRTSIATLTATQTKTTKELNKQRKWQETITSQLSIVENSQQHMKAEYADQGVMLGRILSILTPTLDTTHKPAAGQINNNIDDQNNLVMTVTQGGTQPHQSHPVNLVTQTQSSFGAQESITPPSYKGEGMI